MDRIWRVRVIGPVVALVGVVIFCAMNGDAISQQSPSAQTINALYQHYEPQLPTLTTAQIERMWSKQSQSRPWFQGTYGVLNAGKDDPQLIDTLRKEIPCSETNAQTRDATFSPSAYQFQCMITLSEGITIVLFVNFTSAHTLASAVIYQRIPFKIILAQAEREQQAETGRNVENDVSVLMELHSDILSRIDNARAPSGSYVEYSKDLEQEKFAVRFK